MASWSVCLLLGGFELGYPDGFKGKDNDDEEAFLPMIGEILATGDEIRSGALVDSNSAHIARKLEAAGIAVVRHTCVGDSRSALVEAIREIGQRADVAVVTGGLGPTEDDLSAAAAAEAAGVPCAFNDQAMEEIERFFKGRPRMMSDSNRKQAFLPRGAVLLQNPVGSAPGFSMKVGRCLFFFLPGVPAEMKKMLAEQVLPRLPRISSGPGTVCLTRTLSTFGLTEAATGERLAGLSEAFPGIKLGLRAKFPEIQVKLYAYGRADQDLEKSMEKACAWVAEKLGKRLVSIEGDPMEVVLGRLLLERNATVAVAESCTGGLISHRLTNVPGSSGYFLFSAVTYSNASKVRVLAVSPEILERFGAVHEETAKAMAVGVKRLSGADYGLSTTGIAGPEGGSDEKPVGTVCIGLASPGRVFSKRLHFSFLSRLAHKKIFAQSAMDMLRLELL